MVEGPNGEPAMVSFLSVGEMPPSQIYGEIDPLEGSPARVLTKRMETGIIPLGDFMPEEAKKNL